MMPHSDRKEPSMLIESYALGKITIDGRLYSRDVIIPPDQVWE